MQWASETLRICYVFWVNGKPISPVQVIILSKIEIVLTVIMRREATSTEIMKSVLSYARSFNENYGVHFFDVRIIDILEDMMFSSFLAGNFRVTYVSYISVVMMIIRHEGVRLFLVKLDKNASAAKILVITRLDYPSL